MEIDKTIKTNRAIGAGIYIISLFFIIASIAFTYLFMLN